MPKSKTNRGAAKRLQKTGRGKLKRRHSNYTHIRTKKSPKRKRRLRKPTLVSKSDQKSMRRLLPYA